MNRTVDLICPNCGRIQKGVEWEMWQFSKRAHPYTCGNEGCPSHTELICLEEMFPKMEVMTIDVGKGESVGTRCEDILLNGPATVICISPAMATCPKCKSHYVGFTYVDGLYKAYCSDCGLESVSLHKTRGEAIEDLENIHGY